MPVSRGTAMGHARENRPRPSVGSTQTGVGLGEVLSGSTDGARTGVPNKGRGLFSLACPLAVPRDTGMSVILTSPAYLLAIPVLRRYGRSRLVTGAVLAVGFIAFVNLMHFSQGWVQFGYRFSNDAAPFALILVALGFERLSTRYRWGMLGAMSLVVVSLAINLWGVMWSRLLGW